MSKPEAARYRTTTRRSYNDALKQRGSLLIWLYKDRAWLAIRAERPGRPTVLSDAAIQFCLMVKVLFGVPLRQITGMVASNQGEQDITAPRIYDAMGLLFRFHALPGETMGKLCLVGAVVPPGLGAQPNTLQARPKPSMCLAARSRSCSWATPGGFERAVLSRCLMAVHFFQAFGPEPARILIINARGHMHEAFFTQTGSPVADDIAAPQVLEGLQDIAHIHSVAADVGMVLVPPPNAVC